MKNDKCPECNGRGGFEGQQGGCSSCRTCGKGNAGWNSIEKIKGYWNPLDDYSKEHPIKLNPTKVRAAKSRRKICRAIDTGNK